MTSTNNKISGLISSQLPAFVRDDNPLFVSFMEAYYEYLEQNIIDTGSTGRGRVVERINSLRDYQNIETTLDDFANLLFNQFMQFLPQPDGTRVDFKKILPQIKDFYRARGTEKSYKFLLRLLSNGQDVDIFYPKDHILRASDGKWFVQKSLRVTDTKLNGNLDASPSTLALFDQRQIQGLTSNTTATVERTEQFYELGTLINEIFLTSISNTFASGETVRAQYYDSSNNLVTVTSNIFSGLVTSVVVSASGSGYAIGNPVTFSGGGGTGAVAAVSSVSTGNISAMSVVQGGSGYQQNNALLFSGGGGTGANGDVLSVNTSGAFHPNTYSIDANQISQIQSANWGAAQTIFAISTSNLALNVISSLSSTFVYANAGPVTTVEVLAPGTGYTSVPSISVVSNTTIAALGILGSLVINNGGTNYAVGEQLTFTNPPDGFGFGAKANVLSVNGTGSITKVGYYADPGEIPGGMGYFTGYLPTVNVATASGFGANIVAVSPIGYGASITPTTGTIGSVLGITITSGGQGYTSAPTATLAGYGDGTANLVTSVVRGVYTYPGYFLNQDGFPSSYNFIQDRDYWQNFSYVVRVGLAYEKWIQAVNNLLHPLGTRVWGEYAIQDDTSTLTSNVSNPGYDSVGRLDSYNSNYSNTITFHGNNGLIFSDSYIVSGNSFFNSTLSLWVNFPNYLPNTDRQMTLFELANSALNGGIPTVNNSNNKIFTAYLGREQTVMGYNEWAYSEQMNAANWNVITAGVSSLNLNSIVAPDGTLSGDAVMEDTSTGQHQMGRATANMSTLSLYTYSQYFKPIGNTSWVQMRWSVNVGNPFGSALIQYFNLSGNGSLGTNQGITANSAKIETANNGWYRCQVTGLSSNSAGPGFILFRMARSDLGETYTGDTSSGLGAWGAQFEPTNYQGAGPSGTLGLEASRYTKTLDFAPIATFANDQEELSGTGHYIGINFANNKTGELLYHARTNSVAHPLVTNTWYHFLTCFDTHSQTGPGGAGLPIQGMYLNNVSSNKIIKTTHASSQHDANLNGATLVSLAANTTGQNTYTGNVSQLIWIRYGGVSTQNATIRRAFINDRSLSPNLDISLSGATMNALSTSIKYWFRGNTALPSPTAIPISYPINSGFGTTTLMANATGQPGIYNSAMPLPPIVTFGGGPGSSVYY